MDLTVTEIKEDFGLIVFMYGTYMELVIEKVS
jgi:hypothetical protein